ncbi:MAG: SDR family NAD(P)-dependent oxidoreductase, partial [Ilumatobacteraceae bacterium]
FRGKRVVVTGAASGIGHRVTELLLEAGAHVIALDRSAVDLSVERFIRVDFTDPESIDAAVAEIDGEIDVLLNIAGVPGTADPEVTMRVNVLGLRMLTELLIHKINHGGSVTNVASTGFVTTPWMASVPTTSPRSASWCSPNSTAGTCASTA